MSAELEIYKHLDVMNECCHYAATSEFARWLFKNRTKDYCNHSQHDGKTLCASCKYHLQRLRELEDKLLKESYWRSHSHVVGYGEDGTMYS